jgi:hypothetical protein
MSRRYVGILSDMPCKLGHEALAETLLLFVALSLELKSLPPCRHPWKVGATVLEVLFEARN